MPAPDPSRKYRRYTPQQQEDLVRTQLVWITVGIDTTYDLLFCRFARKLASPIRFRRLTATQFGLLASLYHARRRWRERVAILWHWCLTGAGWAAWFVVIAVAIPVIVVLVLLSMVIRRPDLSPRRGAAVRRVCQGLSRRFRDRIRGTRNGRIVLATSAAMPVVVMAAAIMARAALGNVPVGVAVTRWSVLAPALWCALATIPISAGLLVVSMYLCPDRRLPLGLDTRSPVPRAGWISPSSRPGP